MSPYCLTPAAVRLHLLVQFLAVLVRNKSKPRYSWISKIWDKKREALDEKACTHNRNEIIPTLLHITSEKKGNFFFFNIHWSEFNDILSEYLQRVLVELAIRKLPQLKPKTSALHRWLFDEQKRLFILHSTQNAGCVLHFLSATNILSEVNWSGANGYYLRWCSELERS